MGARGSRQPSQIYPPTPIPAAEETLEQSPPTLSEGVYKKSNKLGDLFHQCTNCWKTCQNANPDLGHSGSTSLDSVTKHGHKSSQDNNKDEKSAPG